MAALAAAYGCGLARDHPYNDGNRRVAIVVVAVLLGLNGLALAASRDTRSRRVLDALVGPLLGPTGVTRRGHRFRVARRARTWR